MTPNRRSPRIAAATFLVATIAAACTGAGPTPSPSAPPVTGPPPTIRPSPTPIAAVVASPGDAAALVIATDPRFTGAGPLDPNVIGASKWWEATPLDGGGYRVELTIGWGDCPAGCIERHVWEFEVSPDGRVELIAEHGDEVPADLPA